MGGAKTADEKAAEKVIFDALSCWTGTKVEPGSSRIPCMRNGQIVGHLRQGTLLTDGPVDVVLRGVKTAQRTDLEIRKKLLTEVSKLAESLQLSMGEMEPEMLPFLDRSVRGKSPDPIVRAIRAIGVSQVTLTACNDMVSAANSTIEKIDLELDSRPKRLGRRPNEAAYEVVFQLAKLYAKVTGEKPTYAFSENGPAGEFTPVAQKVLTVLNRGPTTSLRGAIDAAIAQLTKADMHPPQEINRNYFQF